MKEKIKGNHYVYWGLTLFGVITAAILLVFILLKMNLIFGMINKIISILMPIILGLMFSYLLNPIVVKFEMYSKKFIKFLNKKLSKQIKNEPKKARMMAIFVTYLLFFTLIVLFFRFVLPSLFDSLNMMLTNIPVYLNNIYNYLKNLLSTSPELMKLVDELNTDIRGFVANLMVPSMDMIISNVTQGISSAFTWTVDILIGLIVSIYLVYDRESFVQGFKNVLEAIFPENIYNTLMTTIGFINKIFGGFMVAKIIDSLLIGLITFVIISLFKIPYALIISVIVGVTNIIPYFGPFIGAIPCIGLLLLIDPTKSATFAILILLIQQFDGNVLGPKLIGNKTGIKSFWVLFSILLFGGLFGFVGMIFGVPTFAVIYSLLANLTNKRLAKKKSI